MLSPGAVPVRAEGSPGGEYASYVLAAESDGYEMYLYEPEISILIRDKNTGAFLESTVSEKNDSGKNKKAWKGYIHSGLVLSVIRDNNNTYQADLINSPHTLEYTYSENGFSADVYFTEYGLGLRMDVTLDGSDVLVRIPDDSIREDIDGVYIATISPFPLLGYTYLGQTEGYMLIPDGNGALISLTDKEGRFSSGFSQMIYGSDSGFSESSPRSTLWGNYETVTRARQVLAPVFGMAHTSDGVAFLGIVEEGDTRCSIEAHPNGVMIDYNRCFARFLVRDIYQQPLNQSNSGTVKTVEKDRTHHDMAVRFCLLSGDSANYMGMAVRYREYLLSTGRIQKRDTAYRTRVDFLGTDREKFLIGTTAVVMTTAENIADIYADLESAGVGSLISVCKGWQAGGVYALPVDAFRADGAIGGNAALTALSTKAEESDFLLYLYDDALRINASANSFTYDAMKMVNKRTFREESAGQVYSLFYYLLPERSGNKLTRLAASMSVSGLRRLAVGGISDTLFSYSLRGSYFTRDDCAAEYEKAIAAAGDAGTELALEEPFQYLWKHTGAFLDMPLRSSDYMYVDGEIPFLSLVLKGVVPMYSDYVNFEANKTEFFLRLVESGVYPSFYITQRSSSALIYTNSSGLYSTQYLTYRDTIIRYDRELRRLWEMTGDACITGHRVLEGGVSRVEYSNGIVVYVNFGSEDVTVGGVTIGALSWKAGDLE